MGKLTGLAVSPWTSGGHCDLPGCGRTVEWKVDRLFTGNALPWAVTTRTQHLCGGHAVGNVQAALDARPESTKMMPGERVRLELHVDHEGRTVLPVRWQLVGLEPRPVFQRIIAAGDAPDATAAAERVAQAVEEFLLSYYANPHRNA